MRCPLINCTRSFAVLTSSLLFLNIAYSYSNAQSLIDTGPMDASFNFSWPADSSTTDIIDNVPMFSSFLGTQVSATLSSPLLFSWPQSVYTINHDSFPGQLASENVNIDIATGSYLKGSSDYNNVSIHRPFSCTTSPSCSSFSVTTASGSAQLASPFDLNQTGTSIPVFDSTYQRTASIQVNLSSSFEGDGSFVTSGNYKLAGTLSVDLKYMSFSTSHYVAEAIDNSAGASALDTGFQSENFILGLRGADAGTSGTNLELRDAEYAFLGYNAGSMLRAAQNKSDTVDSIKALTASDSNNRFGGPIALLFYNNLKVGASMGCDVCASIINSTKNPNLPATSPGGVVPNTLAFLYGYEFPDDISGLPSAIANSSFSIPTGNPVVPSLKIQFGDGTYLDFFDLLAQGGVTIQLDPKSSKDYAFSVTGAGISEFELPLIDGSQLIDGATLIVDGKSVQISGGVWIDLKALFGSDPTTILIADLEGSLLPDNPVFDFRFDQTGNVSVAEFGFSPGAVPEPATWWMMIIGFGALPIRWKRAAKKARATTKTA